MISSEFTELANTSLKKNTMLSPLDYAKICSFDDKIFDRPTKQWALTNIKVTTLTTSEVIQVWNLTENLPLKRFQEALHDQLFSTLNREVIE